MRTLVDENVPKSEVVAMLTATCAACVLIRIRCIDHLSTKGMCFATPIIALVTRGRCEKKCNPKWISVSKRHLVSLVLCMGGRPELSSRLPPPVCQWLRVLWGCTDLFFVFSAHRTGHHEMSLCGASHIVVWGIIQGTCMHRFRLFFCFM